MDTTGRAPEDEITIALAEAVVDSFRLRPMRNITAAEVKRRQEAAYECWRLLVQEGGYNSRKALLAVPTVLVEWIDRERNGSAVSLIEQPTLTHIVPHGMSRKLQAERSLSALAAKHGTLDPSTTGE